MLTEYNVAVNFRRIAKWASAISVLLLLAFMVLLPSAYDKMEPMLDPEQQNVVRLESGASSSVDFQEGHVYVALRLSEGGDPSADLRLMVMTTDELYHAYRVQGNDTSGVPEPFVRNSSITQTVEPHSEENLSEIQEGEPNDDWKGWDEG